MNPRKTLSTPRDTLADPRPSATVVALSPSAGRRFRREASSEAEPLGQILLFTGVRYERMPEVQAEPAAPRRKRS